jgi:branched-chain amino acid transport system permease protein
MSELQAAVSGALVGGLYALMAAGLSLGWGMLRVINLAHFGLILLGGYLTFGLATTTGLNPILTIVVTVPVLFVAGAVIQWAFDRFELSEFNSLLVSFGVLIIIIQSVSNVWSADFQQMDSTVNPYAAGSVSLGPLVFPVPTLLAFGFAVVLMVGAHLAIQRTYPGRALRAFAEDRPIAGAYGIDHVRLGVLLAGAGGASAAIAGMLISVDRALTPTTPFEWFGIIFAVVILGGIGNILGTLGAGILVGVVSGVVAVVWSPSAAPLVIFSAIVIALIVRPQGLFSRGAS